MCSDVWLEIFEYFETIQLFTTFARVSDVVDELLFKNNDHFYSRGLVLDVGVRNFSGKIPLHRIISLTLYEEYGFKIIDQFTKLRSLKLIGEVEWVTSIIKDVIRNEIKLQQFIVNTSKIDSLREFLLTISSIISLRRLEICVDELLKNDVVSKLTVVRSRIEQLIISSSSTIDCSSLFLMLAHFSNIRFLDIALIDRHQKTMPLSFCQNLRTLSLSLLEVPFIWIVHLLEAPNSLIKLKLTGLVHDEAFINNEKWNHLFKLAPFLARIYVNLSLEQDKGFYYYEKFQTRLRILNLELNCTDDADDCHLYYGDKNRWWSLKGVIIQS